MKKLLLSLSLALGALAMSAAPVTVDFANADNLPTDDASAATTNATIDGVDFTFFHCKQGTYNKANYLALSGKNYYGDDAAYVSFTAPIATKTIIVHNSGSCSPNVTVQLYAGSTAIGDAVKLGTVDTDFKWAIPEANQAQGTVFTLKTTNKYNAQISTLTFSEDETTSEPEQPGETWDPEKGALSVSIKANDAQNIDGEYNEEEAAEGSSNGKAANYQPLRSLDMGDFHFAFTTTNTNASSAPAYFYIMSTATSGNNTIRVYSGTSMTITAPEGALLRTITFNGSNAKSLDQLKASEGDTHAETATSGTFEWAGNTNEVTLTFAGTYRITSIDVTYDEGTATPAAATPTFSREAGSFTEPFALTISAAEGATIYYTTDGSAPTTSSDVFDAPIMISATTTVRAMATEQGKRNSAIAEATYTLETTYNTLAELIEAGLADKTNYVKFTGKATVAYQNGSYLYVEDESTPMLIYGNVGQTYKPGDVISGFAGKMTVYNNLTEMNNVDASTFAAPLYTVAAPAPVKMDVEDVTADDQNKYVLIEEVRVVATTADGKTTYTLVDTKDADIIAYPRFSDVDFPADDTVVYNVFGFVSVFKEDIQIFPTMFIDAAGVAAIEAAQGNAVYFNMQGQVVANPVEGQILIKVQGGKAQKIIF